MKRQSSKHHTTGLLALLLFGVFASCVLSVLLMGTRVYSRVAHRDEAAYVRRTVGQYVATKVRQTEGAAALSLTCFGEGDALVLTEEIDGETYLTRIYCWEGYLRELFTSAEGEFSPEDGEKLLPAGELSLTLEDGLLTLSLTPESGTPLTLRMALRGGEEGGP